MNLSNIFFENESFICENKALSIRLEKQDYSFLIYFGKKTKYSVQLAKHTLDQGKGFIFLNPKLNNSQLIQVKSYLAQALFIHEDLSFEEIGFNSVSKIRNPSAAAIGIMTSGSTGLAKLIWIGLENLKQRALSEVSIFQLTQDDRILNFLPFSFDVGLNQLLCSLFYEIPTYITNEWSPLKLLRIMEEKKITGISSTPYFWKQLLTFDSSYAWEQLNKLRYITISGGSLTDLELDRLIEKLDGPVIIKTYGQTETFRSLYFHSGQHDIKHRYSLGKPYPGVKLSLKDNSSSSSELIHKGEGMGRKSLVGDEPLSVETGDYFTQEDGYYYFKGRRDDMLKVNGIRFYLQEVENLLKKTLLSDTLFYVLKIEGSLAYVEEGNEIISPSKKKSIIKELAPYMKINLFYNFPKFARLSNGKLDRVKVIEECKQRNLKI